MGICLDAAPVRTKGRNGKKSLASRPLAIAGHYRERANRQQIQLRALFQYSPSEG